MANTYVAVTKIAHNGDTWAPGEVVELADFGDDGPKLFQGWYSAGVITVQGTSNDPSTWNATPSTYATTPRVVEEALRVQAAELFGPAGKESVAYKGAVTQPDLDAAPDDPQGLLEGNPDASGDADNGKTEQPSKVPPRSPAQKPADGASSTGK
jgi:hypothetical protein